MKYTLLYIVAAILLVLSSANAISPNDATNIVGLQNDYLLDSESAAILSPQVLVSYAKNDYWIVVGLSDTTPTVYIPVKNSDATIATGDVETRELIKTEIVVTRINSQKSSMTAGDWPFSNTTKTDFYDLQRVLSEMVPKIVNVETELSNLSDADAKRLAISADDIQTKVDNLALKSEVVAKIVEDGMALENDYFLDPDTNETSDYQRAFIEYFSIIEAYKEDYDKVYSSINTLKTAIAALSIEGLTSTQKNFLVTSLSPPAQTGKITSLASNTQQIKTVVESIFSSAANVEPMVANLKTRINRNNASLALYGTNTKITKADERFNSLSDAAEVILSEDNIDYWSDQDSVTALKTNWTQAKTRFKNTEYDPALSFASKAEKNVLDIIEKGIKPSETALPNDLIFTAIGVLVIATAALFVYEKFIVKKKPKAGDEGYEENFDIKH